MKGLTAATVLRALRARIEVNRVLTCGRHEWMALWAAYQVTTDPLYLKVIHASCNQKVVGIGIGGLESAALLVPMATEQIYEALRVGYKQLDTVPDTDFAFPEDGTAEKAIEAAMTMAASDVQEPKAEDAPVENPELKDFMKNFENKMKELGGGGETQFDS